VLARVQLTLAAALALIAVGLGVYLLVGPDGGVASGASDPDDTVGPTGYVGALAPPGIRTRDFTLIDEDDNPVSLKADRGKVVVLTFMYSTCLDSCPATAQTIRLALNDLGSRAKEVPVLAVSVDPVGDTRTNIRSFLLKQSLLGRMTYLRGSRAQLARVWDLYKVQPQKTGTKLEDSHSVTVMLIGRDGRQRVSFPVDAMTPEGLSHDLRKLLAERG
jgi:protein SCO1/2